MTITKRRLTLRSLLAPALVALIIMLSAACVPLSPAQDLQVIKSLSLSGKLIFIQYSAQGNQLAELDLSSGSLASLFKVPDKGFINAVDVSPDKQQIVMSYAPPPPNDGTQAGDTDLYLLTLDGTEALRKLTQHKDPSEAYRNPAWSPDGQYIYYTHDFPGENPEIDSHPRIERMKLTGQTQVLFDDAEWPVLSPDGSKIAFLTPGTGGINSYALFVGTTDGSSSVQALPGGMFPYVDAHFFTPDGQNLVFSAASYAFSGSMDHPQMEQPFKWPLSVTPVYPHPQASDWYQVTLADRQIKRLISLQDTYLYGAFSPDRKWIAFISQHGVFVVKPDGSDLTQIASLTGVGSVTWIP